MKIFKIDKKQLYKDYVINKKSACKIAKNQKCSNSTIYRMLKKFGIKIRSNSESHKELEFNYNDLYEKYVKNKISIKQIARTYNCSFETIRDNLHNFNIPVRSKAEGTRIFTKSDYFRNLRSIQSQGKNNNMYGKSNKWGKHTDKAKEKIKIAHLGNKNSMFGRPPVYKRIKYKSIWMRSSWEIAFAKWCDKNSIKWFYEPKTFNLGEMTYTPDFYLSEFNLWIEVKGFWFKGAKKRFELFKQIYCGERIKLLEKSELKTGGIL